MILVLALTATLYSFPSFQPSLSLDPTKGEVGTSINVTGEGWPEGDVSIYLDEAAFKEGSDPLASAVHVGPNRTLSATFAVPAGAFGSHKVLVCEVCSDHALDRTFTFMVEPALALDPTTGRVGDRVTASGNGWDPQLGPIILYPDTAQGEALTAPVSVDENGTFNTSFAVPAGSPGVHQVLACQQCLNSPTQVAEPFTLETGVPPATPSITASRSPRSPSTRATLPPSALGGSPPQGTTGASKSFPLLPALSIAVVMGAAIALAGLRLIVRRRFSIGSRKRWEASAEDEARKEPCTGHGCYCRRGDVDLQPHLRTIKSLTTTMRPAGRGRGEEREVDPKVTGHLNEALSARRLDRGETESLEEVTPSVRLMVGEIQRWIVDQGGPWDFSLTAHVEGGEASCPYTLYHCERSGNTRAWNESSTWTTKVTDACDYEVGKLVVEIPLTAATWHKLEEYLTPRFMELIERIVSDRRLGRFRLGGELEVRI